MHYHVFKDKEGVYTTGLYQEVEGRDIVLTRFQQLELLQGCRNENEWQKLVLIVASLKLQWNIAFCLSMMIGISQLLEIIFLFKTNNGPASYNRQTPNPQSSITKLFPTRLRS